MKIKFRINITYAQPIYGFDDEVEWKTDTGVLHSGKALTVVKSNVKQVVDKRID